MEILSATLPTVTPGILNNIQRTRSLSEPPHNLQVVNEIHFYSKQYAQKTISKVAPGAPGPPRGAGARAARP